MATPFRRILVPHDFSKPASEALRVAADLVGGDGRGLTVLHVVVPFTPVAGFPPADGAVWFPPTELVADVRQRLARLVARELGPRRSAKVACRVVVGDPYLRIVEAARGHDAIVMATAGRTGLAHLLIGSVAEKVVRHATVPVLTIRPTGGRARRRARRTRRRAGRRLRLPGRFR
ncbi:MAG TPA: universal stress protein [Candidatus Binatia bacterium]|nr:universal stress protein [Candidatus Binatia bacterium]